MKTVYYNTSTSSLYDIERGRELPQSQYPWVRYREKVDLKVIFITGLDTNNAPVIDTSLDETYVYEAAIDKDYTTDTTVMARTYNEGISVTAASGEVIVSLDCTASEFLSAVDKKAQQLCVFELHGNVIDELAWSIDFKIYCKGTVNSGDEDPEPIPAGEYYSKSETDALLLLAGGITRVADFAELPSSPTDLAAYRVTTLGYNVIWDAEAFAWTTEAGAIVTDDDES